MLFRALRKQGATSREGGEGFTDYVRSLGEGEPDTSRYAALRRALRTALRAELRRKGLWHAPPSYLGVCGWESWEERSGNAEDALEELVTDAYAFVFVDRLRSLRSHLTVKPAIEGLVILSVRQFLHERQKTHDPLGAQVFEVLRSAVREAMAAGELHLVRGNSRIGNDTVLGFEAGAEDPAEVLQPGPASDLRSLVAQWNDRLLPDLVTLRGRGQGDVVRRLRELLPELWREGIALFRFKDLIDPLKADVRARWAAVLEREGGETAFENAEGEEAWRVRLAPPDLRVEDRQFFRKLVACVLDSVAHLDVNETTRGYLYRLWQFRRVQAGTGDDRAPSLRKLGELLGIPRERISGLQEVLGNLLKQCRAANLGQLAVTYSEGSSILGAAP